MKIVRPFGLAFFIVSRSGSEPPKFCVSKMYRGFGGVNVAKKCLHFLASERRSETQWSDIPHHRKEKIISLSFIFLRIKERQKVL
jgi:hypothetical protein